MIQIARTACNMEREPLAAPFGFKGRSLRELWQVAVLMVSRDGARALGLGTQSTLWSDAAVFADQSEAAGNSMMFLMTAFALREAQARGFDHPMTLLDDLLPSVWEYGKRITGRRDLRLTFALNALVAVDHAAWLLYAAAHGITQFDALIPEDCRPALAHRHRALAGIPLVSYGVPIAEIVRMVDEGAWFLKIKIGADPDRDGDFGKMLAWDSRRLEAIHQAVGDRRTAHTAGGRIPYYLDANGRYDSKDRLMRLLDHAAAIGALDRILLLEEPFPEGYREDVRDIPVRLVADESAHTDRDAVERIEMGYGAIALKPIAKTLSMSLATARAARARGVPCFCADLTVNPILVDWNKNVAARLPPLPGLTLGVLESNGHQNYRHWERLQSFHPRAGAAWTFTRRGLYPLDDDFYASSGGMFEPSRHYLELVDE